MPDVVKKDAEQRAAEAEVEDFKEDLGPFVVAAETTRMAMVFTDAKTPDNAIIFANDSFLKLMGYSREEALGQSFNFLMAEGADEAGLAKIRHGFEGGPVDEVEICYRRKDGSQFWCEVFISPVKDEHGAIVQHFASFIDLTRHRTQQAQAQALIDELNHRVKNTLSTVQSIVSQALRIEADPETIKQTIVARLFALSRSHDLLTRRSWEAAGLRELIENALEPFGVSDGRAERFEITGENPRLAPKVILALSVAFHELATNAVKYGAFSNADGVVCIDCAIAPSPTGDRLILRWREKDGPPVAPPTHKGFGSRVLERGLAHELEGVVDLDYRSDGVVCTIDMPAP